MYLHIDIHLKSKMHRCANAIESFHFFSQNEKLFIISVHFVVVVVLICFTYIVYTLHSTDGTITTTLSYDVRFADDFWSGAVNSDDESMTYSKKSNARLAAGRETFVKTATVVATVYVDGNSVNSFSLH